MGYLQKIIIALFLFSAIVTTMALFYGDVYNNYADADFYRDEYLNESYGKTNESYTLIEGMTNKIYNKSIAEDDAMDFTLKNAFSSSKLFIRKSREMIELVVDKIEMQFGLKGDYSYWGKTFLGILLVVIIFTIIGATVRNKW